jgi:hypothetical protein
MNDILLDIPDITVIVEKGDEYKVIVNKANNTVTRATGSYFTYADVAGLANTASYAETSSYSTNFIVDGHSVVTGSLVVTGEITGSNVLSNEYKLIAGAVSLTFTGSITSGIFGATEYVLPFIPTSSYSAATVEYVASRQGGLRVGVILAGWSGSNTTVTDISSTDVGDTSDIRFSLVQDSGYIKLRVESLGSGSYPWTVQSLFKLFPALP